MKTAELVVSAPRPAFPFPDGGRRILIYVVYDRRGDVEDYVLFALRHLREFFDTILVVVNGKLTERGRCALEPLVESVIVRENRGYDIWGYKTGLDHLADEISTYDEVVLANDTWYGPVRPLRPVFTRMDSAPLHFWGMTDHIRVEPNPFTRTGYLAYHLQSYWLAVRSSMFLSDEWKNYWRDLPELHSYEDAVVRHEAVFTELFTGLGYVGEVAFPTLTDRTENHAVLYAEQLVDAGCPTLKRRAFFQWPPYLDHLGVVGRWALEAASRHGYPTDLILSDLARNVAPRVLNTDLALTSVLRSDANDYRDGEPLRTVVIAHVFYDEMMEEIIDRVSRLPGRFDLVVTVPDKEKADRIREVLAAWPARGAVDVRVLASNNGRDQGAFLVGCRDIVVDGGYDLLVKVHSKKTPQDASNASRHFRRQQFDNLLDSSDYAANVVALFQREKMLGIVYPPMVHLGYGTMGHAWWGNKSRFVETCAMLGISVPVDDASPLAPFGSMYFARPDALRPLFEHEWTYEDFGGEESYLDGGLAHVLERMPSYAAGESGYYTRTIANVEYAAVSYTALDYNLDQMSATVPNTTMDQILFLRRIGELGRGKHEDFAYAFARVTRPTWEPRLRRLFAAMRAIRSRARWRK